MNLFIYIAGAFEDKDRLVKMRNILESKHRCAVTASWLNEVSQNQDYSQKLATQVITSEQAEFYAVRDFADIRSSGLVIVDTQGTNIRGGREVECGYALGHGIPVWIVGPRRHVFHQLVSQFDTWDGVFQKLGAMLV